MAPPRHILHLLLSYLALVQSPYAVAQDESQGWVSPYGGGDAPDVVTEFDGDGSFPDFEGTSPPLLDDFYDDASVDSAPDLSRRAAKDFYLRVMPLGASITQGVQSTDLNGYRKWIRSQLRYAGWKVNMVGKKTNGRMADKDNEGWSGYVVDKVHAEFTKSKWMQPNLVLLNAGTNDCNFNVDPGNAGKRMKAFIDDIFASIKDVTVVASTIVKSRDKAACAEDVSKQYREVFRNYKNPRFAWADFWTVLPASELSSDGVHPVDSGYKILAGAWWGAIQKVESRIQPPNNPQPPTPADDFKDSDVKSTSSTCAKTAGTARGPVQLQKGSGHDDGKYVHSSKEKGKLVDARITKTPNKEINKAIPSHLYFAQLINSNNLDRSKGLDDWIRIEHKSDGKNTYWIRENLGGGGFGDSKTFDVVQNCDTGPAYAFADFNNDGLDDFFCIGSGGKVSVSLNQGGNPPKFKSIGQVVPAPAGFKSGDVRIADIDGDGRADYCVIHDNGDIGCSRNGALGGNDDKYYWEGFKTQKGLRDIVFTGKNKGDKAGVVLRDLNGDFRADWMWVSDDGGSVDTWINQRGWGKGIVPDWTHAGVTHGGGGSKSVDNVKFGRIYGGGKLDYLRIEEDDDYFNIYGYENTGHGGTKRKADGNYYCDMRGTGADDYVWIYEDGHSADIYTNIGAPPEWGQKTKISLTVPGPRAGIHLADWDGDGKCDVLVQNKGSGALTLYKNNYKKQGDAITFTNAGVVSGGTCSQGWGIGRFDRGMALADIDGDGRADVLCLEPNSRVTAWLNTKSGLQDVGQVKYAEGWDRANVRFADVEGSGRADLIHLNKYTGAGQVFKNLGHTPGAKGSSFSWVNRGVLFSPIDRGDNMYFANLGGLGRADLVHVLPVTNRANAYFNECGGSSGGDDTLIAEDPKLPSIPGGDVPDPGDPENPAPPDDPNEPTDAELPPDPDMTCGDTYTTLEDIKNAGDKVPGSCVDIYLTRVLRQIYTDAMDKYNDIIADGYDGKFDIYASATVDHADEAFAEWVYGNSDTYFTCIVAELAYCCKNCPDNEPGGCKHCREDNKDCDSHCPQNINRPCTNTVKRELYHKEGIPDAWMDPMLETSFNSRVNLVSRAPKPTWVKVPEPCPPDYSEHGIGEVENGGVPDNTIWWTFKDDEAKANFFTDLYTATAIPDEKTSIPVWSARTNGHGPVCAPSAEDDDPCWNTGVDYGLPIIDGYSKDDVINPKDVIDAATASAVDLVDQIDTALEWMTDFTFLGDFGDLVDSISIPILMIQSAVDQMDAIETIAEEITAAKRKAIILAFIGAILFLIPFAGQALGATAELATIGAIVTVLGEAGNLAFDIYSLVDDPSNAPLAIMSIIFAPLALMDVASIAKAASFRRGMSTEDVAKLGGPIGKALDDIGAIRSGLASCKRL